jgi:hypothetical protein
MKGNKKRKKRAMESILIFTAFLLFPLASEIAW